MARRVQNLSWQQFTMGWRKKKIVITRVARYLHFERTGLDPDEKQIPRRPKGHLVIMISCFGLSWISLY